MKVPHSKTISKRENSFSCVEERPPKNVRKFKEKFTEWFRNFLENSEYVFNIGFLCCFKKNYLE